jgi:ABC-type branched-subunit amino acid transport system substrate-binding protein
MQNLARFAGGLLLVTAWGCASAPPPPPERTPEPPPAQPPPQPPAREAPLRIGVIVSNTGSAVLRQYTGLIMSGARVGADMTRTPRRDVELVVIDDGGTTAGATRAVRELEAQGVRAIIGPLTDEALRAAARARTNPDVLLISPTAVSDPDTLRNVFALNVVDTRGASALGAYAQRFARVGVLYARTTEGTRQARAFSDAYDANAQRVITDVPFDSTTTSVATQLRRLRDARVQAIFFPASERELRLILPQIDYFGLTNVQMLGSESWASDAARGLPQRVLQGAIVAVPLYRESDTVAWQDFVSRYESTYRRSLENAIPALGFDAVLLAARAAAGSNVNNDAFRAATGVLTVREDSITRRPFLVRIDGGRLVPVN